MTEAHPSDSRLVLVPVDTIQRLILAADCYGVRYLDSDDMSEEAEELQTATDTAKAVLSAAPGGEGADADEEEAYQIGKRDGYEEAVQDIDLLTGGDGEYKATTHDGIIDMPVMKARIIERFTAPPEPVAWRWRKSGSGAHWSVGNEPIRGASPGHYEVQPLFTALPPETVAWRDIATAPKDGPFLGAASYVDGSWRIERMEWWPNVRGTGGHFASLGMEIRHARHAPQPTHWMPLPDAPVALTAPSPKGGETWSSMAAWTEETFGTVTLERIATRANEEMVELLADPSDVMEAADVCIVLSRYPGIEDAINRKMAINRARQWKLNGDGSGYHIKGETDA